MASPEQALADLNTDIELATEPVNVFELRGLLEDLSSFAYEDLKVFNKIHDLIKSFDDGVWAPDWTEQAKSTIVGVREKYAADLGSPDETTRKVAGVFFNKFMENRGKGISGLNHNAGVYRPTDRTKAMHKALNEATGFQQVEDIVSVLDDTNAVNFDGFSFAPLKEELRTVKQLLAGAKSAQAGQDYAHLVPEDTLRDVNRRLKRAVRLIDCDRNAPDDLGATFGHKLADHRAGRNEDMDEVRERRTVEMMKENVKDILTTYEAMEDEGSRLFGDSKQYKEMKDAAKKVCDLQKNMDYGDRDKVRAMAAALKTLHEKAEVYADKEAYKEKKTDTGISRKNKALALLELSDINTYKVVSQRTERKFVEDMRLDGKESREVVKTARTYGELIEEEVKKNRKHHDLKEQRKQLRAQREKDKQIRKEIGLK